MTALTTTLLSTGSEESSGSEGSSKVLVVLPSLGTAIDPLWREAVAKLPAGVTAVGVDLPGHGKSTPVEARAGVSLSMEQLAENVFTAVRTAVPDVTTMVVAGDSVGGAIAMQMALAEPDAVSSIAVFCSGAKIGTTEAWEERAAFVESSGTAEMVEGSKGRWFGPGFMETNPEASGALLKSLENTDDHSYAAVCRALGSFDVREQLKDIKAQVIAVAGEHDGPTPPESLKVISDGVPNGTLRVVAGAGHLVPAEDPAVTAEVLGELLG